MVGYFEIHRHRFVNLLYRKMLRLAYALHIVARTHEVRGALATNNACNCGFVISTNTTKGSEWRVSNCRRIRRILVYVIFFLIKGKLCPTIEF